MTEFKPLLDLGFAGVMAGVLIYVVRMMLAHAKAEAEAERAMHVAAVDRIEDAHKQDTTRLVEAIDRQGTKLAAVEARLADGLKAVSQQVVDANVAIARVRRELRGDTSRDT